MVVSCLGPRKDDGMIFICANWSMTCWSTVQHFEATLGLVIEGCSLVSARIMISILAIFAMSLQSLEMSCAERADALASLAGDLKPEDLPEVPCI